MRLLLLALDVALLAASLLAALVALTGGWTLVVVGLAIGVHSVGNLLILITALSAIRYGTRAHPFLGTSWLPLADIDLRAARRLVSGIDWCTGTRSRAVTLVACVVIAGAGLKLANAVAHPGFFSGDDVEIHEMTLGHAFGQHWPVWELRSAFYPMAFIYPVQAFLIRLGIEAPAPLVLAGRGVVTVVSSLGLFWLYRWASATDGRPTALLATLFLGTSVLHIEFGGSELPRSISSVFVVGAFFALQREAVSSTVVAALCLATAACMRFSEIGFFLPAVLQLLIERRLRAILVLALAGGAAMLVIQGVSDSLYWHTPFESARHVLAFTLVDRLSSRGYEPPWYHLTHITAWTDLLTFGLAVAGITSRQWRLALWLWLPVAALSLLPHKEPRYLIPSLPFLCLAAAAGVVRSVEWLRTPVLTATQRRVAVALVAACCLRMVFVVSGYHLRRSDAEVALAREFGGRRGVTRVALESSWRFGGHLYLRRMTDVRDLGPDDVADIASARRRLGVPQVQLVAIADATCARTTCDVLLARLGYREVVTETSRRASYRTFERP